MAPLRRSLLLQWCPQSSSYERAPRRDPLYPKRHLESSCRGCHPRGGCHPKKSWYSNPYLQNQADSSQALSQHVTGSQLAGRRLSTQQSLSLQNKECTGQRWEAKLSAWFLPSSTSHCITWFAKLIIRIISCVLDQIQIHPVFQTECFFVKLSRLNLLLYKFQSWPGL